VISLKKTTVTSKRMLAFGCIITFFMILLITRLYTIQVLMGEFYSNKAMLQQTLQIALNEKRGDILDRNGIPFTRAGEYGELIVFPGIIRNDNTAIEIINSLTGKDSKIILQGFEEAYGYIRLPVLYPNAEAEHKIDKGEVYGVILHKSYLRYDDNSLARHVIGHLRKSDNVPLSGIEKAFDHVLRPVSATTVDASIDARNQLVPGLGYRIAEPENSPSNVWLTLDYRIQAILEDVLDSYKGNFHGGLVVDASTGEILALASRPQYKQYDPMDARDEELSYLAIPFQQYPLGSIFKIVVAAAALENGLYSGDTILECTGGIQLGDNFFKCHARNGGLGKITLREAFAHSCNDSFIRIALEIGGDVIIEMSERLGFGTPIEIGLDNPPGNLMKPEQYAGAGIANLALGQGTTLATPLQVADAMVSIVSNGIRKRLSLVKGMGTYDKDSVEYLQMEQAEQILSPEVASEIAEWMEDVVDYGTGTRAWDDSIGGTAGKTGTPQVSGDPHSDEHGWFAGYFPRKNPRYVIIIHSRERGGGGSVAAPVFLEVARGIWKSMNTTG
jgi:penicillin-binding protein 2